MILCQSEEHEASGELARLAAVVSASKKTTRDAHSLAVCGCVGRKPALSDI